mmetsp:Transcript_25385/g.53123  ORF Transcript_25385/g.53123 Transcript_25385/m.53123 type:complete len:492 (-) Transcript_25385:112-1587(-)
MTSTVNNHRRQAASQSTSPTSDSPSPLSSSRQEATYRGLRRSRQTNNYRQQQQQQQQQQLRRRPNHLHTEEERPQHQHQQQQQGSSMGGARPETPHAHQQPRPQHATLPLWWDPANRANFRTVRREMLRAIFCDDADAPVADAGHPPAKPSKGPSAAAVPFARSQSVSASNYNSAAAAAATAATTTAAGASAGVRGPADRTDCDLVVSGKPKLLGRSHSVSALPAAELPNQKELWQEREREQELIQKQEQETESSSSIRAKAKFEALLPPPRDYFSLAVRYLLLDGPLPLVEVEPLDDHVHDWNRDDDDDTSRNPVITNPAVATINATASATAATIAANATAAAITTITNSPKKKEGTATNKFKTSQYNMNIQQQKQQQQANALPNRRHHPPLRPHHPPHRPLDGPRALLPRRPPPPLPLRLPPPPQQPQAGRLPLLRPQIQALPPHQEDETRPPLGQTLLRPLRLPPDGSRGRNPLSSGEGVSRFHRGRE